MITHFDSFHPGFRRQGASATSTTLRLGLQQLRARQLDTRDVRKAFTVHRRHQEFAARLPLRGALDPHNLPKFAKGFKKDKPNSHFASRLST